MDYSFSRRKILAISIDFNLFVFHDITVAKCDASSKNGEETDPKTTKTAVGIAFVLGIFAGSRSERSRFSRPPSLVDDAGAPSCRDDGSEQSRLRSVEKLVVITPSSLRAKALVDGSTLRGSS